MNFSAVKEWNQSFAKRVNSSLKLSVLHTVFYIPGVITDVELLRRPVGCCSSKEAFSLQVCGKAVQERVHLLLACGVVWLRAKFQTKAEKGASERGWTFCSTKVVAGGVGKTRFKGNNGEG